MPTTTSPRPRVLSGSKVRPRQHLGSLPKFGQNDAALKAHAADVIQHFDSKRMDPSSPPSNSQAPAQAPEGNLFFLGDIEVECVADTRGKAFAPPSMHRSRAYTESGKVIGTAKYGALLAEATSSPSPKGAYFTCVLPHFTKPKTPLMRAVVTRQRVIEGVKQDGVLKRRASTQQVEEEPSPSQLDALVEVSAASAPAPRIYSPQELAETDLVACLPSERDKHIAQLNPHLGSMPPPPPRLPSTPRRKTVKVASAEEREAASPRKKPRTTTKVTTTNTITITEEGDKRTTSNTVTTVTEGISNPASPVSVPESPAQQQQDLDLTDFMGDPIEELRLAPQSPATFQAMRNYFSPTGAGGSVSPRSAPATPSSTFPVYSQNPYQPPHAAAPEASQPFLSPRPQSPSAWIDAFPSPSGISASPPMTGPLTPSDAGHHYTTREGSLRLDSTSLAMMRTYMDMQS